MNWAAWTFLGCILISLLTSACEHGKPRGPSVFWNTFWGAVLWIVLAYFMGGFK